MKKNIFVTILIIFPIFFLTSCWSGRKKIIDEYHITWGNYYNQGWKGYTLVCDICIETNGIQEDIKNIRWNNKIIITEKNTSKKERWFIFMAKGDSLQCCNDDMLLGPLFQNQVDSILKEYNYTDLKEEIYVK